MGAFSTDNPDFNLSGVPAISFGGYDYSFGTATGSGSLPAVSSWGSSALSFLSDLGSSYLNFEGNRQAVKQNGQVAQSNQAALEAIQQQAQLQSQQSSQLQSMLMIALVGGVVLFFALRKG